MKAAGAAITVLGRHIKIFVHRNKELYSYTGKTKN